MWWWWRRGRDIIDSRRGGRAHGEEFWLQIYADERRERQISRRHGEREKIAKQNIYSKIGADEKKVNKLVAGSKKPCHTQNRYMLPIFPAHLFARLAAVSHDVSRDMLLLNTQKYNEIARWLNEMEQGCVSMGLVRTAKQIRAVLEACSSGKCTPARFQNLVKPITGLLVEELSEFVFLAVPRNRVGFFSYLSGRKFRVLMRPFGSSMLPGVVLV
jgi:hypothetical protein